MASAHGFPQHCESSVYRATRPGEPLQEVFYLPAHFHPSRHLRTACIEPSRALLAAEPERSESWRGAPMVCQGGRPAMSGLSCFATYLSPSSTRTSAHLVYIRLPLLPRLLSCSHALHRLRSRSDGVPRSSEESTLPPQRSV